MLEVLARSPVFGALAPEELRAIVDRLEVVHLQEGSELVRSGAEDDSLYVVTSGELLVWSRAPGKPRRLGPGDVIGESALLAGESAPATARASSPTTVARLTRAAFAELAEACPQAAVRLTDALRQRLRRDKLTVALHLSQLFGELDETVLEDLAAEVELLTIHRGDWLMREGDEGDSLYIVINGRVRVVVERDGGEEAVLAELGAGETIGEMAVLGGGPRSAGVYAIRDSNLALLTQDRFFRLLEKHSRALTKIFAGKVIQRLQSQNKREAFVGRPSSTFAVLPLQPHLPVREFCARLSEALSRLGKTTHLTSESVDRALGLSKTADGSTSDPENPRLVEWLGRQELEHDFVVYEADADALPWTLRCLRQADEILLLADPAAAPEFAAPEGHAGSGVWRRALDEHDPRTGARRSLVLLHPDQTAQPSGTRRWLEAHAVQRHHHVRLGRSEDLGRLARFLAGRAFGLVLGGGFARGLAHVGVMNALVELGIKVDLIGGSSMGAVMGAEWALGWDADTMLRRTRDLCEGAMQDLTFPFLAFQRGRKWSRVVDAIAADVQIEDLWTPFFCVSANLNRADTHVHTHGSLRQALLATTRAPGIFPPVVIDGELHVDGGMANNVPVDVMRSFSNGGVVMGVDVSPPHELKHVPDYGSDVNGFRAFWQKFGPGRKSNPYVPNILLVLMRTIEFTGVAFQSLSARHADLFLYAPLLTFKRTDFHLANEIAEVTRAHCLEKVREWLARADATGGRRPWVAVTPDAARRAGGAG